MQRTVMVIFTLLSFSIGMFSCECFIEKCREDCEREIEGCLLACADWSPDAVYICNDNCVFAYSYCVDACELVRESAE
jgi:hypothetical protein